MNWDSPVHFARGQAFLHYFLTGEQNYVTEKQYCRGKDGFNARVDYKTNERCDLSREVRVSEYESTILTFDFFKKDIYGHPPTSDIFLAVSNLVFFKYLGWVEDLHAYHLYNIFATFLLSLTVAIWVYLTYGKFASVMSVCALYLYPLLAGEQQFNVKDPPMAAFFTLAIFLFWLAVTKRSWKLMIFSAIAGGVSFGTKFNFVFAPFILLPWLTLFLGSSVRAFLIKKKRFSSNLLYRSIIKCMPFSLLVSLFLYPIIVFSIFYFSWPVLWSDPVANVMLVVKYYQDIGGGTCSFIPFSFNWITGCSDMIPLLYLGTTIFPGALFFFVSGVVFSFKKIRSNNFVLVLWVIFFAFIFIRVTLPFSKTYGGIRQIIEFIAPFAMLSGFGAVMMRSFILRQIEKIQMISNHRRIAEISLSILFLASYVPIFMTLQKLHPNENLYFNSFVGGVKGAFEKNIYGYGNTYGNAYYQAARWLNLHAVKDAKVVLLWGLNQNISRQSLRDDVTHLGVERSGFQQKGEYQIVTMEQGSPVYDTFRYKYADRFLKELFAMKVDGVSILRIWRNNKTDNRTDIPRKVQNISFDRLDNKEDKIVTLNLDSETLLQRIEFRFTDPICKLESIGAKIRFGSSTDDLIGNNDEINDFTLSEIVAYQADFVYLFAAERARVIEISFPSAYSCDVSDAKLNVFSFKNE
jgi:4-amino-4-deoxy-L-arabinose transferase-like glycosyltransferase